MNNKRKINYPKLCFIFDSKALFIERRFRSCDDFLNIKHIGQQWLWARSWEVNFKSAEKVTMREKNVE